MSNDIEYENRQIIPRWVPFKTNNQFFRDSLFLSSPSNEVEAINYNHLKKDWKRNNTVSFAHEVISSAQILNITDDEEVNKAKKFIQNDKSALSKQFPFIKEKRPFIDDKCESLNFNYNSKIHKIRMDLRNEPNDPILWTDLALFHLIAGNLIKAERCINIALALNSNNYYILRSAARFYVYKDDPEHALRIINNSQFISTNPLLASSEIAIAEAFKIKSKKIKKAFSLINTGNYSPRMLTELYATLATLEFNSGSVKNGKKLLQQALVAPNENSLAQISFVKNRFDGNFNTNDFKLSCQYEANAWDSYRSSDFNITVENAKNWFLFQPLSSRPAILYSYIKLLIFEDYKESVNLLNKALIVSPEDPILLNNKAVALAKDNKISEAESTISKASIHPADDDYHVILATKGLIEIRKGNINLGNQYYLEAIKKFKKENNTQRVARALFYWGNELMRLKDPVGIKLIKESYTISKKINQKDILYAIEKKQLSDLV